MRLVRPNETRDSRADTGLARKEPAWKPTVDFPALVRMMVESDLGMSEELSAKVAAG